MTKIQILMFVATLIYLLIQSAMDIATEKVLVILNNIALFLSLLFYVAELVFAKNISILEPIQAMVICIIIGGLSKYAHWYGTGDAKAMIVIMLSLRYASEMHPAVDVLMFLVAILVANVSFLVFYRIKNYITKTHKNKHAFFPFLTIGYVLTYLLGIACY